jgi:hypothetical protein
MERRRRLSRRKNCTKPFHIPGPRRHGVTEPRRIKYLAAPAGFPFVSRVDTREHFRETSHETKPFDDHVCGTYGDPAFRHGRARCAGTRTCAIRPCPRRPGQVPREHHGLPRRPETRSRYDAVGARGATVVGPPTKTARVSRRKARSSARDRTIRKVHAVGRRRWKRASGCQAGLPTDQSLSARSVMLDSTLLCRSLRSSSIGLYRQVAYSSSWSAK